MARSKKQQKTEGASIPKAAIPRISPSRKPRFQEKYEKEIKSILMKKFGYKNVHQVPRLEKIVINCCVKEAVSQPKVLDAAAEDLMWITGQKPIVVRAKKSVASFKLRKGVPLAVKVTMRRARMYEFLERLIHLALPRVRDFRGVSERAFDGKGNYSLGIREQIVFPEIKYDKVDQIRGLTVTIVTTARNNEEGRALLEAFGMPFRRK